MLWNEWEGQACSHESLAVVLGIEGQFGNISVDEAREEEYEVHVRVRLVAVRGEVVVNVAQLFLRPGALLEVLALVLNRNMLATHCVTELVDATIAKAFVLIQAVAAKKYFLDLLELDCLLPGHPLNSHFLLCHHSLVELHDHL